MNWREFVENELGYTPITTFWEDFSIADKFGVEAIRDTYKRAFEEWHTDYKMFTELVMVLNHKIWQHHTSNEQVAVIYDSLYSIAVNWAYENLKDDALSYFIKTLD